MYDELLYIREKAMATHSSTLAWQIPWTEEPGRLQSMGSLGIRHDWATSLSIFTFHFHALEREMATQSSVLAWRIPGTGEPGGLPSLGSHRVGHDWSNLAAARYTWEENWQPIPVFLPGEFHGQRSLTGYSTWSQRVRHDWVTNSFKTHLRAHRRWLILTNESWFSVACSSSEFLDYLGIDI